MRKFPQFYAKRSMAPLESVMRNIGMEAPRSVAGREESGF